MRLPASVAPALAFLLCAAAPKKPAKPTPKTAPIAAPEKEWAMGPMGSAIRLARGEWKEDACLSAFIFKYHEYSSDTGFEYYFYSPAAWKSTFFLYSQDGNEDLKVLGRTKRFGNVCVPPPELDIDQALEAAFRSGFFVRGNPAAEFHPKLVLTAHNPQTWDSDMTFNNTADFYVPANEAHALVPGAPYWYITSPSRPGKLLVVDGRTGRAVIFTKAGSPVPR